MSTNEKSLKCYLSLPKDFTYDEAVKFLKYFGFIQVKTGKTSSLRVRFLMRNILNIQLNSYD